MHLADQIMFPARHRLLLAGAALLLALMFWAGRTLLPGWQLFWQQNFAPAQLREGAVWLPDFQVDIDALPVAADLANLSGLTFDPERRTLFAITNSHPEIIELSLDGQVLRRIPVAGLEDPEAIEYLAPSLYVVADERKQALFAVRIDAQTSRLDFSGIPELAIGIGRNGNKGFEGLAYDHRQGRLFVAKERDPRRIYEIEGFPALPGASTGLRVADDPMRDDALPLKDLSSLHFDAASGHLLALSDESRQIVELDRQGRPVSRLSLRGGRHGLQATVPQAEGMAMDDQGRLYVVSEPNLFYRFTRPYSAGSGG